MPGLERRISDLVSVRNWPRFLLTYMRLSDRPATYRMRGGDLRIAARSGVDVSTIAVVFIKEDYGPAIGGGTVVDIGANIGVFSLFAAAEPDTRVYAYEPVQATYAQLRENVQLNGLEERVKTFNLGVTSGSEHRAIHLSAHGSPFNTLYGAEGGRTEEIACVGLDRVFEATDIDRCDLLKLDCEGAEFEILLEASEGALQRVRRICVEYHEQADRPQFRRAVLVDHLATRGFRVTHETGQRPSGTLWLVRA